MGDKLIGPFGDEAVAALIAAALSILMWLWGRYSRRKQHQYVYWRIMEIEPPGLSLAAAVAAAVVVGMTDCGRDSTNEQSQERRKGYIRLRLYNEGPLSIHDPVISLAFNQDLDITDVKTAVVPNRGGTREKIEIRTKWKENKVVLQIDRMYPYSVAREETEVSIYTLGQIRDLKIEGLGEMGNGQVWIVASEPSSLPPTSTSSGRVTSMFFGNILFLLVAGILIVFVHPIPGFPNVLREWISHPLPVLYLFWLLLFIIWAFRTALQGFTLNFRFPFTNIVLHAKLYQRYRRR